MINSQGDKTRSLNVFVLLEVSVQKEQQACRVWSSRVCNRCPEESIHAACRMSTKLTYFVPR